MNSLQPNLNLPGTTVLATVTDDKKLQPISEIDPIKMISRLAGLLKDFTDEWLQIEYFDITKPLTITPFKPFNFITIDVSSLYANQAINIHLDTVRVFNPTFTISMLRPIRKPDNTLLNDGGFTTFIYEPITIDLPVINTNRVTIEVVDMHSYRNAWEPLYTPSTNHHKGKIMLGYKRRNS